jgi:hypothetical protein
MPLLLQDVPNPKGFRATLRPADSATRIFDFLALVDFVGSPATSRLKLPLRGKGLAAGLRADTHTLVSVLH